mmetsp:Transcript_36227/g.67357  ORF Transcript_36227/g.67357 Transcript_36227/m.67357 type:complete len:206 (-) Transcript_36227:66-683(-)
MTESEADAARSAAAPEAASDDSSAESTEGSSSPGAKGIARHVMWEANTDNCSICNARFSRLAMRFRHHCRNCGLCVCGSCSVTQAVDAESSLQRRLCKDCITPAEDDTAAGASRSATAAASSASVAAPAVERGEERGADTTGASVEAERLSHHQVSAASVKEWQSAWRNVELLMQEHEALKDADNSTDTSEDSALCGGATSNFTW